MKVKHSVVLRGSDVLVTLMPFDGEHLPMKAEKQQLHPEEVKHRCGRWSLNNQETRHKLNCMTISHAKQSLDRA